jgi:ketosteroid isomerase-like protein
VPELRLRDREPGVVLRSLKGHVREALTRAARRPESRKRFPPRQRLALGPVTFAVAPDRLVPLRCRSAMMSSGSTRVIEGDQVMKKRYVLLALMLVGPTVSYAQTAAAKPGAAAAVPGQGNVDQALTKIEKDSSAALLKKDAAGFGKYFADDAVLTGPDGMVQTKAQLVADVKSGVLNLESSEVSDMKIQVHGDAAVVTYASVDKGKYKTQDISGRFRWTDFFVRRGGTWLIVGSQGTPVQEAKK